MATAVTQAPAAQIPRRVDSNILVEGEAEMAGSRNVLLPIDDTDVRACSRCEFEVSCSDLRVDVYFLVRDEICGTSSRIAWIKRAEEFHLCNSCGIE